MTDEAALHLYQQMVVERHRIWERRQKSHPAPWTDDPVLANRKFTNMFRVLDPGSQFVFDLDDADRLTVIARLVFYRITNLPKTWRMLRAAHGRYPTARDFTLFDPLVETLTTYRDAGNQVFSGAYIIVPEPGTKNDKVEGAVRVTRRFVETASADFLLANTQEERFAALQSVPGLGRFLSMQILTDWGYLQSREPNQSFIVAGPGARRGAALLDPNRRAEDVIQSLTTIWWCDGGVRLHGRSLTVMDVQNTLCEFSKYARETVVPRKKTAYRPANPGVQPRPVLPRWW